jgi:hypothetical protein
MLRTMIQLSPHRRHLRLTCVRALAAGTDPHSEQDLRLNVGGWLRAYRQGLPLPRIYLGLQRGYALTLARVLR